MDKLMTEQELSALASLLSRAPMSPPEQLWAQGIVQRLVAFCQPRQKEEEKNAENSV